MTYQCKCCASIAPPIELHAREMMYGTREPFLYHTCATCGSLQIATVPDDMSLHYRNDLYSSWRKLPPHIAARPSALHRFLRRRRTIHKLDRADMLGALLVQLYGPPEFPFDWSWFRATAVQMSSRILDFGCGTGNLLHYLRTNGFKRLVGYDKFSTARCNEPDLRITDSPPVDLLGQCDLVMSHHAYEHMPDPRSALLELKSYVRPGGGFLLIRIPIASSAVPKEYGRDWVQLDAPRHLVIPSEQGMRALAAMAQLSVVKVWYDSTAFQFIGSEQYRADIPMFDEDRSWMRGRPAPFGEEGRVAFAAKAHDLNGKGQGDQACFILRRDH